MNTHIALKIAGMTCTHCAVAVDKALRAVPGVVDAVVKFPEGKAWVTATGPVPADALLAAVEGAGYGAKLADMDPAAAGRSMAPSPSSAGAGIHVAIIGSGSAAFACAIRAVEGGARVSMIESGVLGGTCVNVGCVPSKIFIRVAQMAHWQRAHPFSGLGHGEPTVNRPALLAQQQGRVEELRQGKYAHVLAAHPDIAFFPGRARFQDQNTLVVHAADGGQQRLTADRFLIATGAHPHRPAIPGLEKTPYWTSTEALLAEDLPAHLMVLGGSVVAVELAQAFRRLGTKVTILARTTLLSKDAPDLGAGLEAVFREEGIQVWKHTLPQSVRYEGGSFIVQIGESTLRSDRLLVATGRTPGTQGLGLEKAGVLTDQTGAIVVDDHLRTSVPHIFAAGDCTNHPQFVYVAAAGGTRAAVNMLGGDDALDLRIMPAVVFTDPQVATVGIDERGAQRLGLAVESRTLTLDNVPRALANFDTRGFIKLVAEQGTGRLLGAQVLAAEGGEIIQAAALAMRGGLTIQDLAAQLFPYLTMVEGIKLCAQTFTKDVKELSCCAG